MPGASRNYTCAFCRHSSEGASLSCPRCGAPVDVQAIVAPSGWVELPAIRDMARLEFGGSSLQIEGLYVPVADFNLAPGDGVYFTHNVLLWKDPGVPISAMSLARGWTRLFAGLPIVMTEARGPGHIAFSTDSAGEMVALPLQPGEGIDIREHVFLAASSSTTYDWFSTNVWYRTQSEQEVHYPIGRAMDRFRAGKEPGLVVIHGGGNVFVKTLLPLESILVKPTALLFKDTSVAMHLHAEAPLFGARSFRLGTSVWLRLYGPGRVAIQSAFKAEHRGRGGRIRYSSPLTRFAPGPGPSRGRSSQAFYLKEGARTLGPFREDQIAGLVLVGRLGPGTPVFREGLRSSLPARAFGGRRGLGSLSILERPRACPACGTNSPWTAKLAPRGWVVFLVLLVVCFPLSWIGLLMRERQCPRCGTLFS